MASVSFVEAFSDNYFWLLTQNNYCAVVDPGDAKPVIDFLNQHNFELTHIILTHHHNDHIGGVAELQNLYNPATVGIPTKRTPHIDHVVKSGDCIELLDTQLNVLETPGHTTIAATYYNDDSIFVGDTLFAGGCGCLFEGTAEQLYHSITAIMALGNNRAVYCAHEYTLANLKFALSIEPENAELVARFAEVKQLRADDKPTVPTYLNKEAATNPFCRCDCPAYRKALAKVVGHVVNDPIEAFALTRQLKDQF